MFVYRNDPRFWKLRIIDLLKLREVQLKGEEHDQYWYDLSVEASSDPVIHSVYSFPNGMTMVFDQYGKQMPEFQGATEEVVPKIRATGYGGGIQECWWWGT